MVTLGEILVGGQRALVHDEGHAAGYFHTYENFATPESEYEGRKLQVFLPRSFEGGDRRYPVVYMNDGNTAFFKGGLANQTWGVAETLGGLYWEGTIPELIVTAIYPVDRNREYTHAPWSGPKWGGLESYSSCVARQIKPFIDANYRTHPGREGAMILGSSHGGLAAFYIANRWPDLFGTCAALSPSFWVGVDDARDFPVVRPDATGSVRDSPLMAAVWGTLSNRERRPRLYLDWGLARTGGPHNEFIEERATVRAREMVDLLQADFGYRLGDDLVVYEDPVGEHNELTWGRHIPNILRFFAAGLLGDRGAAPRDP